MRARPDPELRRARVRRRRARCGHHPAGRAARAPRRLVSIPAEPRRKSVGGSGCPDSYRGSAPGGCRELADEGGRFPASGLLGGDTGRERPAVMSVYVVTRLHNAYARQRGGRGHRGRRPRRAGRGLRQVRRRRCTPTAAPCCASRLMPPTPCRTPSSSRRPGWRDCVIGTGSGRGSTPWPATSATGACARRGGPRSARPRTTMPDVTDDDGGRQRRGASARNWARCCAPRSAGLNAGDQDLIELQMRQGLDVAEIAAMLGVSRNHAHALLSRARDQLETSLGALLVARTGRRGLRRPERDARGLGRAADRH